MKLEKVRPHPGTPAKQPVRTAEEVNLSDSAYVFGQIVGATEPFELQIDAMRARLEALRDPTSAEGLAELTRQMLPLEALALRFANEAASSTKGAQTRVLLLRAALQAQQAYARTFALLHTLALQRKQAANPVIVLHPDRDARDA